MTGLELALAALVVFLASCLQGTIGFGLGMLAAPVIGLLDPRLLPGSVVLLAAGLTVFGVLRDRTAVDFRGTGWALLGMVPGTVGGALLVVVLPPQTLAFAVAGTVLAAVLLSVCGWRPRPRPAAVAAAGAASGLMGTAAAIGGPPMVLVWHGFSPARLRGTMSAFFLAGALVSITALAAVGSIDREVLRFAAVLLPAVLLGFVASGAVNGRLDRARVRRVGLAASAAGAVLVLVQAL